MKKTLLASLVVSSFCLSANAILWDSNNYNNTKAKNFAANKAYKQSLSNCSAAKAKNRWVTTAKHCGDKTSISSGGKTYTVVGNYTDSSSSDARLHKVNANLPSGRQMPTSANIAVNTQFDALGRGMWGHNGSASNNSDGNFRGGRNEVNKLQNSSKSFVFVFDKSYDNEVGVDSGDSGGPDSSGGKMVGTHWWRNRYRPYTTFASSDWTRLETWWNKYL